MAAKGAESCIMTATGRGHRRAVIVAASRALLQALVWAALLLYTWSLVAYILPTWSWEWRGSPLPWWEKFRTKHTAKYRNVAGEKITLIDGWDVSALLFWWLPVLVAALAAYLCALLPAAGAVPAKHTLLQQIGRSLTWQLPPRRFWSYWCDGLSTAEALAVGAWIVIHCVAFWDFLNYYSTEATARSEIGMRAELPTSVMRLEWISYALAWLSFFDFAWLFLPLAHNSFLALVTGLPYSALIRYHRWIGHSTLWMIALHALFFYFYWIANPHLNFWVEFFDWGQKYYLNVLAGSISGLFGLALWITSLQYFRRNFFEVFYRTHIVGFIGFIFFAVVHYGWMWSIFVPGLALYAADYVVRLVQGSNVVTAQAAYVSDDDRVAVVELPAVKGFSSCPVQDIFLLFPTISRWQWHPFTIMARLDPTPGGAATGTVSVALKSYGKWTQEVIRQLRSNIPVPVRVNGAFDGISVHKVAGYDHLLLLGGGIGATPLIALLIEIAHHKAKDDDAYAAGIQHVHFVWVARTTSELSILPESVLALARSVSWLSLHLHHTGKELLDCGAIPDEGPDAIKAVKTAAIQEDAGSNTSSASSTAGCPVVALPGGGAKLLGASPFWWNMARPVLPHGHLLSLMTVLVAFLGACFGLVLSYPVRLEWAEKHYTKDKYYKNSTIVFCCILVQMVGLPMALVVLPWRYITTSKVAPQAVNHTGPTTMASAQLQGGAALGYPETGRSVPVQPGRPDLQGLLETLVVGGKAKHVCVYGAGPAAMIGATAQLVWGLDDSRQKHHARVDFKKYAYEL